VAADDTFTHININSEMQHPLLENIKHAAMVVQLEQ
jgi:hypothetical protein